MSTFKSYFTPVILMMISFAGLVSCDTDDTAVTDGDYFPLASGGEWSYQQWVSTDRDSSKWNAFHWKVSSDTVIEGKVYKQVTDADDGHIIKVIRKEGSKYYGRNHELYSGFTHEYVFFDLDIPVGGSWSYFKNDGTIKTEYVVKAKNVTRTIGGIVYHNVIELDVNYSDLVNPGVYESNYSAKHHYAKDVGEIYRFDPAPALGIYVDIDTYLVSYHQ